MADCMRCGRWTIAIYCQRCADDRERETEIAGAAEVALRKARGELGPPCNRCGAFGTIRNGRCFTCAAGCAAREGYVEPPAEPARTCWQRLMED